MQPLSWTEARIEPKVRSSLQERAELEALRFKWIESEKAGRDLGEMAIRSWICRYWNRFLRQRWLEHLNGESYWVEFEQDMFGVLGLPDFADCPLTATIVEHFRWGEENLHILQWAMDANQPMEEIRAILTVLDVNSSRLPCQFDPAHPRFQHYAAG